jgi:polyphenol oxidase
MLSHDDIIIPNWPAPANVKACITTRRGGVSDGAGGSLNVSKSTGDPLANVLENRNRIATTIAGTPRWMGQVHGIDVAEIDTIPVGESFTADAQVARNASSVCTIQTADCLPVLLCDHAGTVVAGAHAGWRGLVAGVIEATIAKMHVDAKDLLVYFGPAIGPQEFEVGEDVFRAFTKLEDTYSHLPHPDPTKRFGASPPAAGNASNSAIGADFRGVPRNATSSLAFGGIAEESVKAFVPREGHPGKWFADVYMLARIRLNAIGVSDAQIFGGGLCTYTDEARFFSYRRSTHRKEAYGCMASMVWQE